MPVVHITSRSEWDAKVRSSVPTVVDFTATWCGPCKAIAPIFDKLSTQYSQLSFVKVDVDELQDIAKESGVSAMPTFHVYQNGTKIKELVGANPTRLSSIIAEVAALAPPTAAAEGRVLGGAQNDDGSSAREKLAAAAEARLKAAQAQ